MKTIAPYLLAAALLITGVSSVCAVEKKQKENPPAKPTQTAAKDSTAKPAKAPEKKSDAKPDQKSAPKQGEGNAKTGKKYDDFVDKNNNGVDDRRENLKKKDGK